MARNLNTQAREFADQTSELLNKTVTDGIRVSAVETRGGRRLIGRRVTKTEAVPELIPLTQNGSNPVVYLYLLHAYDLDPENTYLTMTSSIMSLYTSREMNDNQLIVSIDYTREPTNKYPGAHMHVAGVRNDLDAVYLGNARSSRKLRDLHFPVGGKRFRPSLEDIIEFTILEKMVEPRPNWRSVVDQHRTGWEKIQLQAAVRRDPQAAADQLKESGWDVTRN